ncbi:MAG: abc-2 type transporter [Verrucomicrobiales bacterium]|nr:abc-2 type transporter [Verrucomicrobiales bacterium]
MLTVEALSYSIPGQPEDTLLLNEVAFALPPGHFMAIVGPSGCGKTTLLKIIAGLQSETSGRLLWRGEDLAEDGELHASDLGYVPQFSIAHDPLTVGECVENAIRLRTTLKGAAFDQCADEALQVTGLTEISGQRVAVLSGGQKRRLGLAMEWVSRPALLLCDEVTSGLDPRSAREIVQLLHNLSRLPGHSVVNVTHSLEDLHLYDSILVLTGGRLAYHGTPASLAHYFSVEDAGEVYPRLLQRSPEDWHASWQKRRGFYYAQAGLPCPGGSSVKVIPLRSSPATDPNAGPDAGPDAEGNAATTAAGREIPKPIFPPGIQSPLSTPAPAERAGAAVVSRNHADDPHDKAAAQSRLPDAFAQFQVLLGRRLTLFFRDRTQLLLQLALLFGFPLLVVLFAPNGIGAMPENAGHSDLDPLEAIQIGIRAVEGQTRLGGQLSGLVMFQVILLTLMGANNSSREIAGERLIFEKERLAGLRPVSYLMSKAVFLIGLVTAQSLWMAFFVDHFAHLPGPLMDRAILLWLVNAAMTAVCLAISALLKSPDQASLLSIYLVGFQLPLSGAVLALPEWVEKFLQPFIAAYWAWSGQLATMRPTDYFVALNRAIPTPVITDPTLPLTVLGFHLAAGMIFAWIGCLRHRWD